MNLTKSLKRYLQPMVRFAETPRRFTRNSVGHLRVALFLNFLKITCMNHASTKEAQLLAFYKRYSEQLLDQLADAHETIGGLRYYLEINRIELPKHLQPKKKDAAEEKVTKAETILMGFCLN